MTKSRSKEKLTRSLHPLPRLLPLHTVRTFPRVLFGSARPLGAAREGVGLRLDDFGAALFGGYFQEKLLAVGAEGLGYCLGAHLW